MVAGLIAVATILHLSNHSDILPAEIPTVYPRTRAGSRHDRVQ